MSDQENGDPSSLYTRSTSTTATLNPTPEEGGELPFASACMQGQDVDLVGDGCGYAGLVVGLLVDVEMFD